MNRSSNFSQARASANTGRHQAGFNLLEVLVAIMIFSIGMLALAKLQGSLTQTSGHTKARAAAAALAQERIERMRGFGQILVDTSCDGVPDCTPVPAFEAIVSETTGVSSTLGGTSFTTTWEVEDFSWDGDSFEAHPAGQGAPDYKLVRVTVDWDDPTQDTTANAPDTSKLVIQDIVSSSPVTSSGRVLSGGSRSLGPSVSYTPGQNPDVAAISLGANRFKETLVPEPEVFRKQDTEFVLTAFDVITYSQDPNNSDATFLRREEFVVTNCECQFTSTKSYGDGRRPTVWDGSDYKLGPEVSNKPVGTRTNTSGQEPLCEICCRDHHDGGTLDTVSQDSPYYGDAARALYNPWRPASEYQANGNHKHYWPDNNGVLQAVTSGNYLENCRFIRENGYFQIAQDLHLERLTPMAGDYLDDDAEVGEYSTFVTDFVGDYLAALPNDYPVTVPDPSGFSPETTPPTDTVLPIDIGSSLGQAYQQLRSRAIYIDYLTKDVRDTFDCLNVSGNTGADCNVPTVFAPMEVIPFFELNTTLLGEWSETPINKPADVTNERLESDNAHSRGFAVWDQTNYGITSVRAYLGEGNNALTNTSDTAPYQAYNPLNTSTADDDAGQLTNIDILMSDGSDPEPPVIPLVVQGSITTEGGTQVDGVNVLVTAVSGAVCDKTGDSYLCEVTGTSVTMTVSKYTTANKDNSACVLTGPAIQLSVTNPGTVNEYTTFYIPSVSGALTVNFVIRKNNC